MLDQVLDVDPTNIKAYLRKIQMHLNLAQVNEASALIAKAEKYALKEDDRQSLRSFKAKITGVKVKEKEFSQKIFANGSQLYEDKPAQTSQPKTPTAEELNKDENEMLKTLSTMEWFLYPFVKTYQVFAVKLGCRKQKKE